MARPVIEADLEDYLDRIRQLERALLLLWRGRRAPRRVYCALRRARLGQLRAGRVDNVVNGAPGVSAQGAKGLGVGGGGGGAPAHSLRVAWGSRAGNLGARSLYRAVKMGRPMRFLPPPPLPACAARRPAAALPSGEE